MFEIYFAVDSYCFIFVQEFIGYKKGHYENCFSGAAYQKQRKLSFDQAVTDVYNHLRIKI